MRRWGKFFGRSAAVVALGVLAVASGCASSHEGGTAAASERLGDETFVAVYRGAGSRDARMAAAPQGAVATQGLRALSGGNTASAQDFYLAIRKEDLDEKWFLSAFMKQYVPGQVDGSAARSLGTRVVTFKIQNDKLFVFDVDERRSKSSTFKPEIVVEAYPLVTDYTPFSERPGSNRYVLVDPSAGLNDFGVVSDDFGSQGQKFKVDLTFLQSFRRIADGVTYEQVFTGIGDKADEDSADKAEFNQFRGSGTLGIGLRKYKEGAGFTPIETPEEDYFFPSDPYLETDTGEVRKIPGKWNLHRGMKPIKWLISDEILATQQKFPAYDIIGAVKKGIENWNAVFGYKVFEAVVGNAGDSWADDDLNMVIWDNDPSTGYAFADWRSNPNTGEIRGASIYVNSIWIDENFEDDVVPPPPPATPTPTSRASGRRQGPETAAARPATQRLSWSGVREQRLCQLWAPQFRAGGNRASIPFGPPLTKKDKVEGLLASTVLHEIGHVLGLRHNFKGTLETPSTSVMDYIPNEESARQITPGTWDIDALKLLYGVSTEAPRQAFCTDEALETDPTCLQFDLTDKPLTKDIGPFFTTVVSEYLEGVSDSQPNSSLNRVLGFLRASDDAAERLEAWNTAIAGVRVPVSATLLATAGYGERADKLTRKIYARLFLDPADARGDITNAPKLDAQVAPLVFSDLKGNVTNADGIRSWQTRRLAVDVLKAIQSVGALETLRDARGAVAASRIGLTGEEGVLADDLLARIDRALAPYFD